jgi:vacuolar-type H+-ATPase subunit I/STV1
MGSQFHRLQWGCIILLLFFTASCSLQGLKTPEGAKEFSQETNRVEKLAHEDPKASVRAKSHLRLAFLYVNHRNPQLNYSRALQEMESYLSLAPAEEQTEDFQNWFAVLKEVGKLRTSLETAQKANKTLRDEVAGLKEMNNKMRETIEKLKSLDRQMEEKRNLTK